MHHNYVFLRGTLQDVSEPSLVKSLDAIEIRFSVATGNPELGDHHPVTAFGSLAIEILAAKITGTLPVECLLEGWLRSDGDHSHTLAQDITLHLSRSQRKRLRWEIERLKSNMGVTE
jgi:hypothetical protein